MEEVLLQSVHHRHFPALGSDARRDMRLFQEHSQGIWIMPLVSIVFYPHMHSKMCCLVRFPARLRLQQHQPFCPKVRERSNYFLAVFHLTQQDTGSKCQLKTNGRCCWPTVSAIQIRCLPRNSNDFFPTYTHYLLSLQSKCGAKMVS